LGQDHIKHKNRKGATSIIAGWYISANIGSTWYARIF